MPPETCPHCGAEVPRDAAACPECGSDEQTGWSETANAQRLDLPDGHFDYDEFVREEFDRQEKSRPRGFSWLWWAVAIGVAGAMIALLFLSLVR